MEAVVGDATSSQAREELAAALIDGGVPLRQLKLFDDPRELSRTPGLRGDLREPGHGTAGTREAHVG